MDSVNRNSGEMNDDDHQSTGSNNEGSSATNNSSNSLKQSSCDPLKMLNFVECISTTTNSIEIQIMINKFVSTYI